jgi:UDP-N-acetyl-D-galactosamine dehydrogenase
VEFGEKYHTVVFDINTIRFDELDAGKDVTLEVEKEDLLYFTHFRFSFDPADQTESNFYIDIVPTPVDKYNNPNLTPPRKASESIRKFVKKGDIVVFESSVHLCVTEAFCAPILE